MLIISIASGDRGALGELKIVAREAEFFEHHRLAVTRSHFKVHVDVVIRVAYRLLKIGLECFLAYPAPVVRPDMDVHVIDVRAGVDLLEQVKILLASVIALTSG